MRQFDMRTTARLVGALVVAATIAACHGVTSPSSYPDDDFSGTITPGTTQSKNFNVGSTGEIQMTLQTLSPRPVVGFLWIGVGQPAAGSCQPLLGYYTTQAPVGQGLQSFGTIQQGSYCMFVSDGNSILTQPTSFTLQTKHP
jgi:hypothetical protein